MRIEVLVPKAEFAAVKHLASDTDRRMLRQAVVSTSDPRGPWVAVNPGVESVLRRLFPGRVKLFGELDFIRNSWDVNPEASYQILFSPMKLKRKNEKADSA